MKMHFKILIIMLLFGADLSAQTVIIDIMNIRSNAGQVQISIYRSQENFDNDQPFLTRNFSKRALREGRMRIKVNLAPGIYGIAMMDDENANGRMDYTGLGIPTEGFGFSNYMKKILKRPEFKDFKFIHGEEGCRVLIKVNYL